MIDPQTIANEIRDRISDHPSVQRDTWTGRAPADLATELAHELIGEALGTRRPVVPAACRTTGTTERAEPREPALRRALRSRGLASPSPPVVHGPPA